MPDSKFDYDPEIDSLPPMITFWIIVGSIGMGIYLSIILV